MAELTSGREREGEGERERGRERESGREGEREREWERERPHKSAVTLTELSHSGVRCSSSAGGRRDGEGTLHTSTLASTGSLSSLSLS